MPSWFDLMSLDPNGPEDTAGINAAAEIVKSLIDAEESQGISSKRVVLGGFSQGGGLALHVGLRHNKPLAGIAALSAWLPLHKEYPGAMKSSAPVYQAHGDVDQIVPYQWGALTSELMKSLISDYQFKIYKGLAHSSSPEELDDLKTFFAKCLPATKKEWIASSILGGFQVGEDLSNYLVKII